MKIHRGGHRVIFMMMNLGGLNYFVTSTHKTAANEDIFWDWLGREGCCKYQFGCKHAWPAYMCRIDAEAHPNSCGCCCAGLLNKQQEGSRKTRKIYQAVRIHEIMEIQTLGRGL